jgi:hypothetical protein
MNLKRIDKIITNQPRSEMRMIRLDVVNKEKIIMKGKYTHLNRVLITQIITHTDVRWEVIIGR